MHCRSLALSRGPVPWLWRALRRSLSLRQLLLRLILAAAGCAAPVDDQSTITVASARARTRVSLQASTAP